MSKKTKEAIVKNVSLNGVMTFGQLRNGLRTADFECYEDVQVVPTSTNCRVQIMHDGNVYITELPSSDFFRIKGLGQNYKLQFVLLFVYLSLLARDCIYFLYANLLPHVQLGYVHKMRPTQLPY